MKTRTHIFVRIAILLFASCFIASRAEAQKPEDLMIEANALYNESAYDSAARVYEKIISNGYSSATLYYNLGNTYYKLRNYPLAILYYEKSLKLDPNNSDTKHNINIAKSFISDKIEEVPELFIKTWWKNLGNIFTINTWTIITLIGIGITLICIFLYITARTKILKKSMFFASLLLIILNIGTFSISFKKYNYLKNHDEGIIINPTITVKSSPSSSSVDLFVLHEGSKVKILDRTDKWEKIKIANGSIGWLPSSSVIKY